MGPKNFVLVRYFMLIMQIARDNDINEVNKSL